MSDTTNTVEVDLSGKVAVITGAGAELGLALALLAAQRGMKVALADADPTMLAAAQAVLESLDVEILAECTRQSALGALQEFAWRVEEELGPPWLVCNTAAGSTIESNLWGVIHGVQVFTPGMVTRGSGHIVNIAAEDLFGVRGPAVDLAVRQAIVGVSQSLYRELDLIGSPVGVSVVCPSLIETTLTSLSPGAVLPLEAGLRVVPPEELAQQIFAAIETREFWLSSHAPQILEATRADRLCVGCSWKESQQSRKGGVLARGVTVSMETYDEPDSSEPEKLARAIAA